MPALPPLRPARCWKALSQSVNRPVNQVMPGYSTSMSNLMEMSPTPEAALRAGDQLRTLVPDSGHLYHMPTHIDFQCGHYHNVVVRNSEAIEADRPGSGT